MEQKSIVYKKVGEWEDKGNREALKKRIDKWLEQFEDSEKEEMLALLANFDYFSENKIKKTVQNLYEKFKAMCNSDDTVFIKIYKEYGTSFSDIFSTTFWLLNGLYDSFTDNPNILYESEQLPKNIVIVDDFFGSGNTFIKFIKLLISKNPLIKDLNIFFVAQQGTFIGTRNIENFAKKFNLTINIITLKLTRKAFEYNNIYNTLSADRHRQLYEKICDRRSITMKFGYEEIEALVSFYYNSPNNTLGIFWSDVNDYKALFPRHKKTPTKLNEMRAGVKSRDAIKEKRFYRSNVEDYKDEVFMVYCLEKGSGFTLLDACKDFGFTESQMSEILKRLSSKGYIVYEKSKFVATNKLKKFIYSSKVKDFNKTVSISENSDNTEVKETKYLPKDFDERFSGYKK